MKIIYERTGGFAGIKLILNLNTMELPPEDAQLLQ
jgi:hypothetical protein